MQGEEGARPRWGPEWARTTWGADMGTIVEGIVRCVMDKETQETLVLLILKDLREG